MRDLIDREAALACFHDWVDRNGDIHTADEIPEYQRIEALPSVGGWISCTERMPEEHIDKDREQIGQKTVSDNVLITFADPNGERRFVDSDRFSEGHTIRHSFAIPVAWMPLPEPYRKEDGEQE